MVWRLRSISPPRPTAHRTRSSDSDSGQWNLLSTVRSPTGWLSSHHCNRHLPQRRAQDAASVSATSIPLHHMTSHARHASVVFEVADMCALPYEDGRFDVVIEKGTLDVLFTEAPSLWQPPAAVCERMDTACNEIRRVLSPTGRLFSITFTQPHFRRPFFHRNDAPPIRSAFE